MLTKALGDEHVAFWVKASIASDTALVQILALRGHRAAMAEEPAWAEALNDKIRREIDELGTQLFALHSDIDRYLRDSDIARGVRDTLADSANAAGRALGDGASAVGRALGDGTNAAGRVLSDSAGAAQYAAARARREARRRLKR